MPIVTRRLFFWSVVILTTVLWFLYRFIFFQPVWFDELISKAIFFGGPVWLFTVMFGNKELFKALHPNRLYSGLTLGVGIGGLFGFVAVIAAAAQPSLQVESALLFSSQTFWYEFGLALLTGWWESLLFFGLVLAGLLQLYRKWPPFKSITITASIFVLLHIPAGLKLVDSAQLTLFILLNFLFAIGQGLVFYRWRNLYALTLIHAIWGMVLLMHVGGV